METPLRSPRILTCTDTTEVVVDDMRNVAIKLRCALISSDSLTLFLERIVMLPAERLSVALVTVLAIMQLTTVAKTVPDALSLAECRLLVEAEDAGLSDAELSVIHSILAVKERWALHKSVSGFFVKARAYDGEGGEQ